MNKQQTSSCHNNRVIFFCVVLQLDTPVHDELKGFVIFCEVKENGGGMWVE
jgi:hypothetical protein